MNTGSVCTVNQHSAAAVLLSHGTFGHRVVKKHTHLLYHQARFHAEQSTVITAMNAGSAAARLRASDDAVVEALIRHLEQQLGGIERIGQEGLNRISILRASTEDIAQAIASPDSLSSILMKSRTRKNSREPKWVSNVEKAYEQLLNGKTEKFSDLLHVEFSLDRSMPLDLSWLLMLIDGIAKTPSLSTGIEWDPRDVYRINKINRMKNLDRSSNVICHRACTERLCT